MSFIEKRNEIHEYLPVKFYSNLFMNLLFYAIYQKPYLNNTKFHN